MDAAVADVRREGKLEGTPVVVHAAFCESQWRMRPYFGLVPVKTGNGEVAWYGSQGKSSKISVVSETPGSAIVRAGFVDAGVLVTQAAPEIVPEPGAVGVSPPRLRYAVRSRFRPPRSVSVWMPSEVKLTSW